MRVLQFLALGLRVLLFGALGFGLGYLSSRFGFGAPDSTALNFGFLGLAIAALLGGLWGRHLASFFADVLLHMFD